MVKRNVVVGDITNQIARLQYSMNYMYLSAMTVAGTMLACIVQVHVLYIHACTTQPARCVSVKKLAVQRVHDVAPYRVQRGHFL